MHKIKSEAAWGGKPLIENVKFKDFKNPQTICGMKQVVFNNQKYASDYIPRHVFKNCIFEDIGEE